MSTDGDELWFQTIPKVGYTQIMVAISLKIQSSWATYLFFIASNAKILPTGWCPPSYMLVYNPITYSSIYHKP